MARRFLRCVAAAGFVLDEYLAELTEADLEDLGDDPVLLAAELCMARVWEPVAGGYRVLDAEAVQVCADRVRELREADARRASSPGPGLPDREPVAVGTAGTTRFGSRNKAGTAASFRCGWCGGLAGAVIVARAGTFAGFWRPSGRKLTTDGLVLDCFLGTSWHPETAGIVDQMQALIEQGNVDPVAIREISWTLCYVTPFYCPERGLNYCASDWDTYIEFNVAQDACIMGICPNGHRHICRLSRVGYAPSAVSSPVRSRAAISRSGLSAVAPPEATKVKMLKSARSSAAVRSIVAPPWGPTCQTSTEFRMPRKGCPVACFSGRWPAAGHGSCEGGARSHRPFRMKGLSPTDRGPAE